MESSEHFSKYFNNISETLSKIDHSAMENVVDVIVKTFNRQGTIYIFGNGGSGATASHVAGDWIKGVCYGMEGKRLKILCLNDNFPAMSAISNDISYDHIFSEQLKNFCDKKDLIIGISGSGNSENIVNAIKHANSIGAISVAVVGFKGGKASKLATHYLLMPIDDMEIVEDLHLVCFHAIKQRLIQLLNAGQQSLGKKYDQRMV
jgi:D-sedoheptulose 7-phosphate isomerase